MKKHTLLALVSVIALATLSGCAKPPTPFPEKAQEQNTVALTGHLNVFSYNGFETQKNWLYHMTNKGGVVNTKDFALFWYLAQHSDKITIYGSPAIATELKRNLLHSATVQRVNTVDLCYLTSALNCGGNVEVFFQKGTVYLPENINQQMFSEPVYYK